MNITRERRAQCNPLGAPDRAGQRVFSLHLQITKIGRCSVPYFPPPAVSHFWGALQVQSSLSFQCGPFLQWFAPSLAS